VGAPAAVWVCVSINGNAAAVSSAGLFALKDNICNPSGVVALAEATNRESEGADSMMESGVILIED